MLDNTGNGYLMRVSPDNTKLALVHYIGGLLTMFDIDPTTGILSNVRQFHFAHNLIRAEFSSSSRYLYLNGGPPKNAVDQIDLAAGDSASIMLSETTLPLDTNRFKETPRLGTDGRIYIAMDIGLTSQADRYARILEPDQPGLACNTDTAGLVFPNYSHNPLVWNYWPFTPSYLGTTEYQAQANKLRAWPVPSRDDVSIDLGLAPDHASVLWIDAAGRTVRTQPWPAHTSVATFDRGSLPSGAYIIDVRPENSSPRRAKVMLE